jgi:hypothetical protein
MWGRFAGNPISDLVDISKTRNVVVTYPLFAMATTIETIYVEMSVEHATFLGS